MAIHVFREQHGDGWQIWTDCQPGHYATGRCIAVTASFEDAVREARVELTGDLAELEAVTADDALPADGLGRVVEAEPQPNLDRVMCDDRR